MQSIFESVGQLAGLLAANVVVSPHDEHILRNTLREKAFEVLLDFNEEPYPQQDVDARPAFVAEDALAAQLELQGRGMHASAARVRSLVDSLQGTASSTHTSDAVDVLTLLLRLRGSAPDASANARQQLSGMLAAPQAGALRMVLPAANASWQSTSDAIPTLPVSGHSLAASIHTDGAAAPSALDSWYPFREATGLAAECRFDAPLEGLLLSAQAGNAAHPQRRPLALLQPSALQPHGPAPLQLTTASGAAGSTAGPGADGKPAAWGAAPPAHQQQPLAAALHTGFQHVNPMLLRLDGTQSECFQLDLAAAPPLSAAGGPGSMPNGAASRPYGGADGAGSQSWALTPAAAAADASSDRTQSPGAYAQAQPSLEWQNTGTDAQQAAPWADSSSISSWVPALPAANRALMPPALLAAAWGGGMQLALPAPGTAAGSWGGQGAAPPATLALVLPPPARLPGARPGGEASDGLLCDVAVMALQGVASALWMIKSGMLSSCKFRAGSCQQLLDHIASVAEVRVRLEAFLDACNAPLPQQTHHGQGQGQGQAECDAGARDPTLVALACELRELLGEQDRVMQDLRAPLAPAAGAGKRSGAGHRAGRSVPQRTSLLDVAMAATCVQGPLRRLADLCLCWPDPDSAAHLQAHIDARRRAQTLRQQRSEKAAPGTAAPAPGSPLEPVALAPSAWQLLGFPTGVALLDHLYAMMVQADAGSQQLLRRLLGGAARPYLQHFRAWLHTTQQPSSAFCVAALPPFGAPPLPAGAVRAGSGVAGGAQEEAHVLQPDARPPVFAAGVHRLFVVAGQQLRLLQELEQDVGDIAARLCLLSALEAQEANAIVRKAGEPQPLGVAAAAVPGRLWTHAEQPAAAAAGGSGVGWPHGGPAAASSWPADLWLNAPSSVAGRDIESVWAVVPYPLAFRLNALQQLSDVQAVAAGRREAQLEASLDLLQRRRQAKADAEDLRVLAAVQDGLARREAARATKDAQAAARRAARAALLAEQQQELSERAARVQEARERAAAEAQALLAEGVLREHRQALAQLAQEMAKAGLLQPSAATGMRDAAQAGPIPAGATGAAAGGAQAAAAAANRRALERAVERYTWREARLALARRRRALWRELDMEEQVLLARAVRGGGGGRGGGNASTSPSPLQPPAETRGQAAPADETAFTTAVTMDVSGAANASGPAGGSGAVAAEAPSVRTQPLGMELPPPAPGSSLQQLQLQATPSRRRAGSTAGSGGVAARSDSGSGPSWWSPRHAAAAAAAGATSPRASTAGGLLAPNGAGAGAGPRPANPFAPPLPPPLGTKRRLSLSGGNLAQAQDTAAQGDRQAPRRSASSHRGGFSLGGTALGAAAQPRLPLVAALFEGEGVNGDSAPAGGAAAPGGGPQFSLGYSPAAAGTSLQLQAQAGRQSSGSYGSNGQAYGIGHAAGNGGGRPPAVHSPHGHPGAGQQRRRWALPAAPQRTAALPAGLRTMRTSAAASMGLSSNPAGPGSPAGPGAGGLWAAQQQRLLLFDEQPDAAQRLLPSADISTGAAADAGSERAAQRRRALWKVAERGSDMQPAAAGLARGQQHRKQALGLTPAPNIAATLRLPEAPGASGLQPPFGLPLGRPAAPWLAAAQGAGDHRQPDLAPCSVHGSGSGSDSDGGPAVFGDEEDSEASYAPVDVALHICSLNGVWQQYTLTTRALWHILLHEYRLMDTLASLRRIFFGEAGDLMQALVEAMARRLEARPHQPQIPQPELAAMLAEALACSALRNDPFAPRLRADAVHGRQLLPGTDTFFPSDRLLLTVQVPWPLSCVVGQTGCYSDVFSLLLRLRWVQHALAQVWRLLGKATAPLQAALLAPRRLRAAPARPWPQRLAAMRQWHQAASHFTAHLAQHMQVALLGQCWGGLQRAVTQQPQDVHQLRRAHAGYLQQARAICLLPPSADGGSEGPDPATSNLQQQLMETLQRAHAFAGLASTLLARLDADASTDAAGLHSKGATAGPASLDAVWQHTITTAREFGRAFGAVHAQLQLETRGGTHGMAELVARLECDSFRLGPHGKAGWLVGL